MSAKEWNIVFLDAWTTSNGDLPWTPVERLGHFTAFDRTDARLMGDKALDADIVIVNKFPVNRQTLACMPKVKYIVVAATGYNNIDREAVEERGIPVSNVRDYSTDSVAQHVFSMLLAIFNRSEYYHHEVKKGRWAQVPDFCFYDHSIAPLAGKVMGIIGFGAIGRRVADIGHAFGMKVLAVTRDLEKPRPDYVHYVPMDELLAQSDIITLHCALTPATEHLIRAESIAGMKDGVVLVNTGRGQLLDEAAVLDALDNGKISCAALDVLSVEPPSAENRLWQHPKAFVTPHIAWAGRDARRRLLDGIAAHIAAFQQGQLEQRVY
jgi:glycerate dehydrogenase